MQIAVIGAGQMGRGIAQVAAQTGAEVLLYDTVPHVAQQALTTISAGLDKVVEKGKMSGQEKDRILSAIRPIDTLQKLNSPSVVIEAIVEDLVIKERLFKELDPLLSSECILASNTSSLPITKLAALTSRPHRFIGMHFMNPVPVMKLVEIIRGLQTSDDTYDLTVQLADKMGKITVLGVDSPGFIVNRILVPMINEAIFLLQEGVEPKDIDVAMKLGTNQPMGPLELADFVGLDTLLSILRIFHRELGEDKYRPCPLLIKYVEAGWIGRKCGKGFYNYG
jgi:3-hydroxybutyryl-CoA dehydrogenase